jgi:hypothetical protein
MKAINTRYKGYKFRSRLEARWAVFFDTLGIEWDYEVEGFVLSNGNCYLPDFFLPTFNGGMYVEVKPKELTKEERDNCLELCNGSGYNVWLAVGKPDLVCYEVFYHHNGDVIEGDGIPCADQAEFENRMFAMSAYGEVGKPINRQYRKLMGQKLITAIKAAKEARFEYGEKP